MHLFYVIIIYCFLLSCTASQKFKAANATTDSSKGWNLIFRDNFDSGNTFDTRKWAYCERQKPAWNRFITQSTDYAFVNDGKLVLRIDNQVIPGDDVPYHSGGVQTKGKFSFTYGKVEVKAKFTGGRGSWPAIWMMPANDTYGGWPKSGEIDIMEHVNKEKVVHQTIHNGAVTGAGGGSTASKSAPYDTSGYNIYGIIWTAYKIDFYINNTLNYTYQKPAGATDKEWPFDKPFYLILNQSGGAGWPGPITDADLPFYMYVDWVKVYQEKKKM